MTSSVFQGGVSSFVFCFVLCSLLIVRIKSFVLCSLLSVRIKNLFHRRIVVVSDPSMG